MTRNHIIDLYADTDDILFADGLDEAIIGFEPNMWRVVYSRNKCIEILSRDMSEEDAMEYLEYNTFNTYVGDKTPVWVDDWMPEQDVLNNSSKTPMQRVINAFNRLSADEFHKYIYDHGYALLEDEESLIKQINLFK